MAEEMVGARFQVKDENGNAVLNDEGKAIWEEGEVAYDFGDDLNAAVDLCGEEAVHSQYKSAARVTLQGIIRAKMKDGLSMDAIQDVVNAWKPGVAIAKTVVDPATAVAAAYDSWSDEKKAAFLKELGV